MAVLPFANLSGDPDQDYFADGMVEEIITALSRMRWLFVIARNSSFAYKGRAVDIKQIGRELGVRYLLEGSVRRAATRVRITGQLVEASTGVQLWADRFEGGLEDLFDLQDQVTASVVGATGTDSLLDVVSVMLIEPPAATVVMSNVIFFTVKSGNRTLVFTVLASLLGFVSVSSDVTVAV